MQHDHSVFVKGLHVAILENVELSALNEDNCVEIIRNATNFEPTRASISSKRVPQLWIAFDTASQRDSALSVHWENHFRSVNENGITARIGRKRTLPPSENHVHTSELYATIHTLTAQVERLSKQVISLETKLDKFSNSGVLLPPIINNYGPQTHNFYPNVTSLSPQVTSLPPEVPSPTSEIISPSPQATSLPHQQPPVTHAQSPLALRQPVVDQSATETISPQTTTHETVSNVHTNNPEPKSPLKIQFFSPKLKEEYKPNSRQVPTNATPNGKSSLSPRTPNKFDRDYTRFSAFGTPIRAHNQYLSSHTPEEYAPNTVGFSAFGTPLRSTNKSTPTSSSPSPSSHGTSTTNVFGANPNQANLRPDEWAPHSHHLQDRPPPEPAEVR